MNGEPAEISSADSLGRAVFDGKKAENARKGKIDPKIFRERGGIRSLSVDMLSIADKVKLTELHDKERDNQAFHGWATVSNAEAKEMGRSTMAIATDENKWHAEILLPLTAGETEISSDDQKAHSLNLANNAVWEEKFKSTD